jgi:hypothetical protein
MEEWRYSSTILDLGIRWRWVVSFMPQPFSPWGKSPQYPFKRRLGGLKRNIMKISNLLSP